MKIKMTRFIGRKCANTSIIWQLVACKMRWKLPRIDWSITADTVGQKPNNLGGQKSKIVSENWKSIFGKKTDARFGDDRVQ